MTLRSATAIAHPNIAFIKYWGNRNHEFRIPSNGSISMNLDGLETKTTVRFDPGLDEDQLLINKEEANTAATQRASTFLDLVRERAGVREFALIESSNNFPMGSGIASSASAFAALALAASKAAGLEMAERELSILARRGSGSASRSVPAGFVEWQSGSTDADSFAESMAPPEHWNLVDCVTVVDEEHKLIGSSGGHQLADTSPLQAARVEGAFARLEEVRRAILEHDFQLFSSIVEADSLLMHAVMMTSEPSLIYWSPASVRVLKACQSWRNEGFSLASTMDAGPNVHVICPAGQEQELFSLLKRTEGVKRVLVAGVGGAARLLED